MRIVLNDHSGHAFPLQLSRHLAQNGFEVLHAYSTSFQSPKGNFEEPDSGYTRLRILPIAVRGQFKKYSLLKRRRQEIEYARQLTVVLDDFKPDVVLSGTTPLFVQEYVQGYCVQRGIKFIYWCQDIYTVAIRQIARQRLGVFGWPIWAYFRWLERRLLQKSDHIVSITEDFNTIFQEWEVDLSKVTCIPNWAPITEISLLEKDNQWARSHQLTDKICVVYSGTLGLKHNPSIIASAAEYFRQREDVQFIVISEGLGASYLTAEKEKRQLDNLQILPFQDFRHMSQVLATADILMAILEKDAGTYSVPSKVLTYLCAQKPIVLAMPPANLSASIVQRNNAGYCVPPDDATAFCKHIERLLADAPLRQVLGKNGRAYAETHFNISRIQDRFLHVFKKALLN